MGDKTKSVNVKQNNKWEKETIMLCVIKAK